MVTQNIEGMIPTAVAAGLTIGVTKAALGAESKKQKKDSSWTRYTLTLIKNRKVVCNWHQPTLEKAKTFATRELEGSGRGYHIEVHNTSGECVVIVYPGGKIRKGCK